MTSSKPARVFLRKVLQGKVSDQVKSAAVREGALILTIVANPLSYEFFVQDAESAKTSLGEALTKNLSSEKIGGFTGVFFGLYATGNGEPSKAPADFNWFEYRSE